MRHDVLRQLAALGVTLAPAQAPFNKLRMTVLPNYDDMGEPALYPFQGKAPQAWDFERFDPAFFRRLDGRVAQLRALGIEADLILFRPYDKGHSGCDRMAAGIDDRYLRSIHNSMRLYDNNKPWVMHASIRNGATVKMPGTPSCTATSTTSRSCSTKPSTRATSSGAGASCRPRTRCCACGKARSRVPTSATAKPTTIRTTRKRGLYEFVDKDGHGIDLPGRPYMALRIVRLA